ncbi:MAG: beta-propeller domain-containing protein, partial [Candidatus Hadarchaeales archaeon]
LTDLGSGEEIYAVRFIGDKGYVVTFRETDPLHVIDLSHPSKPEVVGELKVPGYSSYLHPINDNLLLGIGRENWKVKVSLFDLSSPSQPIELDKLLLEEYWSEILETHHAFLLDPDHEVFFLPAFGKGYVISYGEKDLEVVRVVENRAVRRAVYLEDYLYVISEENLTVLNERTWETVNEIEL